MYNLTTCTFFFIFHVLPIEGHRNSETLGIYLHLQEDLGTGEERTVASPSITLPTLSMPNFFATVL